MNQVFKEFKIQYEIVSFINPCENIKISQQKKKELSDTAEFYTEEQVKKIYDESIRKYSNGTNVYRLGWSIVLLLYSGMRISELLALTWDDIDYNSNTITVNKNVQFLKKDGKYQAIDQDSVKTKSGTRLIPINSKSKEALQKLQEITGHCKYIMSTKPGGRIYPRNIDRMFRNISTAVNVPLRGVHSLRHTFASMLSRNGCDVQVVSSILGHSDTTITRNIYIHIIEEQKQKAMQSLDNYIK